MLAPIQVDAALQQMRPYIMWPYVNLAFYQMDVSSVRYF